MILARLNGVGARLTLSLAAMASLTVCASLVAVLAVESLRETVDRLASTEVERLVRAASLGQQSEAIQGHAPLLLLARGQWERAEIQDVITRQRAWLGVLIDRLAQVGLDAAVLDELEADRRHLIDNLTALDRLVENRNRADQDLHAARQTLLRVVRASTQAIDQRIGVLQEGLIVSGVDGDAGRSRLREMTLLRALDAAQSWLAVNITAVMTGAVTEAVLREQLAVVESNLTVAQATLAQLTSPIRPILQQLTLEMADAVVGPSGALVQFEIAVAHQNAARQFLAQNRETARRLADRVNALIEALRRRVAATGVVAGEAVRERKIILQGLAATCIVVGCLIALYVHMAVVRRLDRVTVGIRDRDGDQPLRLPVSGNDEIAQVARGIEFFSRELGRREKALRESEESLDLAIAATGAGIWVRDVATGRIHWRPQLYRLLGHDVGAVIPDVDLWEGLIHADDHRRVTAVVQEYLAGQRGEFAESYRLRHRDGHYIWVEDYGRAKHGEDGRPVRLAGVVLDVSARKQMELELRESEERHRRLVENLRTHVLYDRDPSGRVVYVSPSVRSVLGLEPETVRAARGALCSLTGNGTAQERVVRFRSGLTDPIVFEAELTDPNGAKRHLLVAETPVFDSTGQLVAVEGIASDITDRVHAERQLRLAKEAAEEAARAKSTFLATMSHEIRTPMNGVLGMLDVLGRSRLDTAQRENVRVIRESAAALLTILDDILDFSKIEAGHMRLEPAKTSLCQTIDSVAELMAPSAREKKLDLIVEIDPSLPDCWMVDRIRLRQILINLASNAIKFTQAGGVMIRVGPRSAEDGGSQPTGFVVEVIDTGIGLDPSVQANLFQPFTQANPSTTRRFGGSGLGLSISKRLVDMMGGIIGASGRKGDGAIVWFALPLSPVSTAVPDTEAETLRGRKVLLICANPVMRWAYGRLLGSSGAEVEALACASQDRLRGRMMHGTDQPVTDIIIDHAPQLGVHARSYLDLLRDLVGTPVLPWRVTVLAPADLAAEEGPDVGSGVWTVLTKPLLRRTLPRGLLGQVGSEPDRAVLSPVETVFGADPAVTNLMAANRRFRVLVAEDNPTNQVVIVRMLEQLALSVEIAENGEEAWRRLQSERFDLLLTDCFMPDVDGYVLARRIRAQERAGGLRLPIVALTASALKGAAESCFEAGMDDFLSKPIDLRTLHTSLARWLPLADLPLPPPESSLWAESARPTTAPEPVDLKPVVAGTNGLTTGQTVDAAGINPVLDWSFVMELYGSREVAGELLQYFLETTAPLVATLRTIAVDVDVAEVRSKVHTIAGAAKTAGALELARLCSNIEHDMINDNKGGAFDRLPSIIDAFSRVQAAIARLR